MPGLTLLLGLITAPLRVVLSSVSGFVTLTASTYVPGHTCTVSPELAASTAPWIVVYAAPGHARSSSTMSPAPAIQEYVLLVVPAGTRATPTVGEPLLSAVYVARLPPPSNGIVPEESKCTPKFHPAETGTPPVAMNVCTPADAGVIVGLIYFTTFPASTITNSNGFVLSA